MKINQIYETINSIAQNMQYTGDTVVDTTTFADFGKHVLSSDVNRETFYNILVDRIGRTAFAIRTYKSMGLDIRVDTFTFGAIYQKIRFGHKESEDSSSWNNSGDNPYTVESNTKLVQNLYNGKLGTFSYVDIIYDYQLESAFTSPVQMGSFFNSLYTNIYNELESSSYGLELYTLNSLIGALYSNATTTPRRCRKVLTEYNTLFATELTSSNALTNKAFLDWLQKEFKKAKDNMRQLTRNYNDGTVNTHTDESDLSFYILNDVAYSYETYYSEKFNAEFVKLPRYKALVNFGQSTQPNVVKVSIDLNNTGNATPITVNNVIGVMCDKDACVCTLDREREISMYDKWNARTPIKVEADKRYMIDLSENAILWVLE